MLVQIHMTGQLSSFFKYCHSLFLVHLFSLYCDAGPGHLPGCWTWMLDLDARPGHWTWMLGIEEVS